MATTKMCNRSEVLDPRYFALQFARAVSQISPDKSDWVARKGVYSLHSVFVRMFPDV